MASEFERKNHIQKSFSLASQWWILDDLGSPASGGILDLMKVGGWCQASYTWMIRCRACKCG